MASTPRRWGGTVRRAGGILTLVGTFLVAGAGVAAAAPVTASGAFLDEGAGVNQVSLAFPDEGGDITGSAAIAGTDANGCPWSLDVTFHGRYEAGATALGGTADLHEVHDSNDPYNAFCGLESSDDAWSGDWAATWSEFTIAGSVAGRSFELTASGSAPTDSVPPPVVTTSPPAVSETPGTGNADPVVDGFSVVPTSPTTDDYIEVYLDAHDPDGDELTYAWVVNGDVTGVTTSGIGWDYPTSGWQDIAVTITDGRGGHTEYTFGFTIVDAGTPSADDTAGAPAPTEPTELPTTSRPTEGSADAIPTERSSPSAATTTAPTDDDHTSVIASLARRLRDTGTTPDEPSARGLAATGATLLVLGLGAVVVAGPKPSPWWDPDTYERQHGRPPEPPPGEGKLDAAARARLQERITYLEEQMWHTEQEMQLAEEAMVRARDRATQLRPIVQDLRRNAEAIIRFEQMVRSNQNWLVASKVLLVASTLLSGGAGLWAKGGAQLVAALTGMLPAPLSLSHEAVPGIGDWRRLYRTRVLTRDGGRTTRATSDLTTRVANVVRLHNQAALSYRSAVVEYRRADARLQAATSRHAELSSRRWLLRQSAEQGIDWTDMDAKTAAGKGP